MTKDKDGIEVLYYFNVDSMLARKPTEAGNEGGNEESVIFGSSGCFIATAAFGSLSAREVITLTSVRDSSLLGSETGNGLVSVYYLVSPAAAREVAAHPALALTIRRFLLH